MLISVSGRYKSRIGRPLGVLKGKSLFCDRKELVQFTRNTRNSRTIFKYLIFKYEKVSKLTNPSRFKPYYVARSFLIASKMFPVVNVSLLLLRATRGPMRVFVNIFFSVIFYPIKYLFVSKRALTFRLTRTIQSIYDKKILYEFNFCVILY